MQGQKTFGISLLIVLEPVRLWGDVKRLLINASWKLPLSLE